MESKLRLDDQKCASAYWWERRLRMDTDAAASLPSIWKDSFSGGTPSSSSPPPPPHTHTLEGLSWLRQIFISIERSWVEFQESVFVARDIDLCHFLCEFKIMGSLDLFPNNVRFKNIQKCLDLSWNHILSEIKVIEVVSLETTREQQFLSHHRVGAHSTLPSKRVTN